jgi:hypothetical protein
VYPTRRGRSWRSPLSARTSASRRRSSWSTGYASAPKQRGSAPARRRCGYSRRCSSWSCLSLTVRCAVVMRARPYGCSQA